MTTTRRIPGCTTSVSRSNGSRMPGSIGRRNVSASTRSVRAPTTSASTVTEVGPTAVIVAATAEGRAPRPTALQRFNERLTDPEGLWSASMLRDLEAGGRVEADHIVGWMLERARKHRVDDTILSIAYTHLKTYERRREAGRLS